MNCINYDTIYIHFIRNDIYFRKKQIKALISNKVEIDKRKLEGLSIF